MKVIKLAKEVNTLSDQVVKNEKLPPISQLIQFWPIIKLALNITMFFTGAKADRTIKEIIKWGDMLAGAGKIAKK